MSECAWGQESEVDFILRIGTGAFKTPDKTVNRRSLLVRYRNSLKKRVDWGDISDPEAIKKLVNEEIKKALMK